jgi:predicted Zn-dependent protease
MTQPRSILAALLLASALGGLAGCTQVTNPATGQSEFTAMSPAQEAATGKEQHPKILAQFGGAYDDPELQAYVSRIGGELAKVSELPDLQFTFTLLNSEIVNAFALPGGYVYVSRGLLALAQNEAELAGVLAHEIGHVTARHSAQRYSRGVVAQGGLTLGTVLAGVFGGRVAAEAVQQLGGAGAQAYLAGYSRDQEFQADELGVRYLARAGYDPKAMSDFLAQLDRNDQLARKLAGKEGQPDPSTNWFATHPRTPERVARAVEQAGAGGGRLEEARYLAAIDGLIYGDDPSQGFVRGQRFIHPELRISFDAPAGFRLLNTPAAILGQGPGGSGFKFDADELPSGMELRDYMVRDWARALKATSLRDVRTDQIEGLPVVTASTTGKLANGPVVDVGLAAIQAEPNRVYRFMFLHPGQLTAQAAQSYQATVQSFRRLSRAEAQAIKPLRVETVEVGPGQTSAALAERMAVRDLPQELFEVLNGLTPGAAPAPGATVKLIVE